MLTMLSAPLRRRLTIIYTAIFVCFSVLALSVESLYNQPLKQRVINDHANHLKIQQHEIRQAVQNAGEITLFLSRTLQLSNPIDINAADSQGIMQFFMQSHPHFLEATLFDLTGHEKVRFNRYQGLITPTPTENLQNKSDRDYMFMRHNYRSGVAYFSQIDLNIEFGTVEVPHNEVIRFITPVVNAENVTTGYIKTKLSSRFFTDRFSNTFDSRSEIRAMVVGKNGYYMMHPEDEKRWGWQLDRPQTSRFFDEYPETWMKAQASSSGVNKEAGKTLIFSTFDSYSWGNMQDLNGSVVPMPNTENLITDGALPDAVAIIEIDQRIFDRLLIGHSPLSWVWMGLFLALLGTMVFYYLKQLETDQALYKSQQVMEHTHRNLLINLGHEIRTPLNGMLGVTELLEAETPRQTRLIKHMQRSIERFITLFSNLATAQRLQNQHLYLRQEPLRLNEIAEPIRDLFKVATEVKTLEFSVDYDHIHGERFICDRYYLQLLISILLDNAVKFTEQGFVKLSLSLKGNSGERELVLSIQDTGLGMTTEEIELVRNLFVKGATEMSREDQGIGSGLWVADQLLSLMKGKMDIKSERGKGTIVTVTLPSGVLSENATQSRLA